jgi:hypothetical protein
MMWIEGIGAVEVLHAYAAAGPAFLMVVALTLASTIATHVLLDFPALGVWMAIAVGAVFTSTPWGELVPALRGAIFLLSLVVCAPMMPVDQLPRPGRAP